MNQENKDLAAEANAFNQRISERVNAGFIPDLRRAVKCDYFYKSFWRDPLFIDLYLGQINQGYLELLKKYCPQHCTILDVGCGAGYMSLELARNGYNITAFDISSSCINEANSVLKSNPYTEGFGSLTYTNSSLEDQDGLYDVVLFSVSLHHMLDLASAIKKAKSLIKPNGHLMCYEPCHDFWTVGDAAQVALIRGILSITGKWHDPSELKDRLFNTQELNSVVHEIHTEFLEERDKNESGQSPNDNESTGKEMLEQLRENFVELEFRKGHSFIYRLLGGIRGSNEEVYELAKFLAAYEKYAVASGILNPNGFYFIGKNQIN